MPPFRQSALFPVFVTTLLLLIQLLTFSNAQNAATNPPPTVNIQPYARGRVFSASTASPMSRTISRLPELVENTASLIEYFEAATATVRNSLAISRSHRQSQNDTLPICNTRSIPWRAAVANTAEHRGWTVDRRAHCLTDIYGATEVSEFTDENLEVLFARQGRGLHMLRDDILDEAGLTNWTRLEGEWRFPTFQRGSQTCTLESAAGRRIGGKWYTTVMITNRPRDEWLPSGERQYLVEHVRVEGNRLVAAKMTLPVNPVTGTEHKVETESTTVLTRWGGAVEPSQFHPVVVEENVALEDALDKGQHHLQQVQDATTGSNVAILALPVVLSLVPFGLVTDITQTRMLVYVLLSDVVTALPMFIKGVELVQISEKRFTASVTRVGDMSVAEEITVTSEVWVASCGSDGNVAVTGIIFIVLAIVSMFAGMGLEIYVRTRQGEKNRKVQVGQFDAELEEYDDALDEWVGVSLEKTK